MSIKYYRLAKGETPPEEFCAVRDVGGEPSEYVFYVPESDVAKLRELVRDMWDFSCVIPDEPHTSKEELDYSVEVWKRMRELGVEP